MRLDGLHHVTAITADIATNLDFYGCLLGLRLVCILTEQLRGTIQLDRGGGTRFVVTFEPGVLA